MRIALLQIEVDPHSRSTTLRHAADGIVATAEGDPAPDLICLPGRLDGLDSVTSGMTDTFVETLAFKAREMGLHVTFGFREEELNHTLDSAVWCDADGDVLLKQQRITRDASSAPPSAMSFRIAPTLYGRVGLLVGDDAWSIPLVGAMQAMGARLIVVPCCRNDLDQRLSALCEQARSHGLWMVVSNSIMTTVANGGSVIIDPNGQVVCNLGAAAGTASVAIQLENQT